MRTNIDIDDELMSQVLAAGPYKTKKEAVEAGLVLLKRQAAMRELAKMGGTVTWGWDGEEAAASPSVSAKAAKRVAHHVAEPVASYAVKKTAKVAAPKTGTKPRARR